MTAEAQARYRDKNRNDPEFREREAEAAARSKAKLRLELQANPDDSRHGTLAGYTVGGCRCTACTRAQAAYSRARMDNADARAKHREVDSRSAAKLARELRENPGDPRHGKLSSYTRGGCRCEACKSAQRDYYQRKGSKK